MQDGILPVNFADGLCGCDVVLIVKIRMTHSIAIVKWEMEYVR
jgi:hypothetical protein